MMILNLTVILTVTVTVKQDTEDTQTRYADYVDYVDKLLELSIILSGMSSS
jgi:hypothetical protein